ncbi:MAG: Rne/Rng family ribonuclease [Roseovarius sp.]|nr:Rne/Rng family ribonuclease [Roseovarius sp.]
MAKKMLIDATHAEETRVVVVDGNKVEEFDFESENKRQLAGNIYLAKVTRVEPSLQAAFVDYGGNRHGFLAFSEIHPDYYQIPVADREALLEEERAYAEAMRARDEEEEKPKPKRASRSRKAAKAEKTASENATVTSDNDSGENSGEISGMETIDLEPDTDTGTGTGEVAPTPEGMSPMETVKETPVAEPVDDADAPEGGKAPADAAKAPAAGNGGDGASREAEAKSDAAAKDASIESVADDDDSEDIRPPRKPRPRRYKIQEVIKVRQILLVQVVKEERGNKGAALTTYLSLAGRYCVLMPNTARGGGISRKITNAADRKKLKDTAAEIDVPQGAGLIIRTAGAKRTKAEIKRDYEYLQRLWEQIRELTLKSIAPAKIYEEGDLIKRSIRDLYNREIDEVLVEGERGYRIAKDFMKMIMPSHAKNVKHYQDAMPLFARYQVESYLSSMFNPTVQLKSGGYIVIGVTEALVAIDVNSGRATKEGSIEETALKTNLEAADEISRQLRLRDLAGLIVIDFIDMDERKNNAAVEKRMKERLKTDRARIQVGRISGFGLMEMSRQRLRPGMIEATTQPCPACHGTGLIRSDDNLALSILRQIEEEGVRRRCREVLVKCPVGIANFLINQKREHVAQIEARYGLSVRIEGDPALVSPDFVLEKFKTATRNVPEVAAPVVSVDSSLMNDVDTEEAPTAEAAEPPEAEPTQDDTKPKKRRRRRRRRSKASENSAEQMAEGGSEQADTGVADPGASPAETEAASEGAGAPAAEDAGTDDKSAGAADAEAPAEQAEEKPKKKRTRKPRKKPAAAADAETATDTAEPSVPAAPAEDGKEAAENETGAKPAKKPARRVTRKKKTPEADAETGTDAVKADEADAPSEGGQATTGPAAEAEAEPASSEPAQSDAAADRPAPVPAGAEPAAGKAAGEGEPPQDTAPEQAEAEAEPKKAKRRGWWALGR